MSNVQPRNSTAQGHTSGVCPLSFELYGHEGDGEATRTGASCRFTGIQCLTEGWEKQIDVLSIRTGLKDKGNENHMAR